MAYQLLGKTGKYLTEELTAYTTTAPLVTQLNADALDLQLLEPNDVRSWLPFLVRCSQQFPDIKYLYYGNADGDHNTELEKRVKKCTVQLENEIAARRKTQEELLHAALHDSPQ